MALTEQSAAHLGIDDWPESVWLLVDPQGVRHGVFRHEGVFGLACFRNEEAAKLFSRVWGFSRYSRAQPFSFDDARAVAQSKSTQIVCMYLFSAAHEPESVHWIR